MPQHTPPPLSFPLHIENVPAAIAGQPRFKVIRGDLTGNGLDAFRASFNTVCADRPLSRIPDSIVEYGVLLIDG